LAIPRKRDLLCERLDLSRRSYRWNDHQLTTFICLYVLVLYVLVSASFALVFRLKFRHTTVSLKLRSIRTDGTVFRHRFSFQNPQTPNHKRERGSVA
jgi:hypothetical protein